MNLKFHQCSKCSNLDSVPFDVGYVCPATGREFDRKEINKPILCRYYKEEQYENVDMQNKG